jgi:fatty acid desaturase
VPWSIGRGAAPEAVSGTLQRMESVLLLSGLLVAAIGTWRGYANARLVVAPWVHAGDATRTALEATQPLAERARMRRAARNLVVAVGWLILAMYGLFLVASAETAL